jgi:hypothetical protein
MTPETRYKSDREKYLKKEELGYSTIDVEFGPNYNIYTLNFKDNIVVNLWISLDDDTEPDDEAIASFEKNGVLMRILPVRLKILSSFLKENTTTLKEYIKPQIKEKIEVKTNILSKEGEEPEPNSGQEELPLPEPKKVYHKPKMKVKKDTGFIGLVRNLWKAWIG